MTDVETLMWRLGERHDRLRATMSLLVSFDRALDRVALRHRIEELTRRVPLLRCRVAAGVLGMLPPRWEPDPEFSVDTHLRVALGAGTATGGPDPVSVAEDVIGSPFPPGRPPWRAVLVPGPVDSLVLHLHHSYTDGLGGVRLVGELFDLAPGGSPAAPPATGASGPFSSGPGATPILDGLQRDLQSEMLRAARLAGSALPWALRSVVQAAQDPERVLDVAARAVGSARIQKGGWMGPASPVLRARSAGVRVSTLEVPVEALRRAGHRLGATVNDVFLGALLEGLTRYHEKCAVLPPSLRLGIPMSARPAGDGDAGLHNQLYGAVLAAPLGPLDFDERTRLVHEMVGLARRQPWLGLIEDAAGLAARAPGAVALLAAALGTIDVVASNVTGPPVRLYLEGAGVERMVPLGPRSGSAINATLLSYCGRAHIGLNLDPGAVADTGVLVDCLRGALEDNLPAA